MFLLRHSCFGLPSSFDIRASAFPRLPSRRQVLETKATTMSVSIKTVPRHIAIIMDGNGRWAKGRGLPRIKGHEAGAQAVRECVEGCGELKVAYLTLYAFSAENWQRRKGEVIALMRLLEKFLKDKTPELIEKNVRLQAIGRLTDLPDNCQKRLHESIKRTASNTGLTLILALS